MSDELETFRVVVAPNFVHPNDDPASNYNAVWLTSASPSTPYRGPDSQHEVARYLLLDPRFTDADGHVGSDDWWFVIERYWPSDYPAQNHGRWGREVNFHNVAGDAGPGGGVGWGFGDGVSSLALDWLNGRPAPEFSTQPNNPNHEFLLPVPTRDEWHTYVVHWIAGRTDGTTLKPGALTVYADGANTPVIDKQGINTVQRAKAPDGGWYVQRWMQLWEGDYTSDLPVLSPSQLVLTRIGKTLEEALADRPHLLRDNAAAQRYRGSGVNLGPPSATRLPSRLASQSKIPDSLGGGSSVLTEAIEELTSTWYYKVPFQRDNPVLAPAVAVYLNGGARPADSLIGNNHYARGLVLLEDIERG